MGWQLFILDSSQSDSIAFPSCLDTYATRLLTEPLSRTKPKLTTVDEGRHLEVQQNVCLQRFALCRFFKILFFRRWSERPDRLIEQDMVCRDSSPYWSDFFSLRPTVEFTY